MVQHSTRARPWPRFGPLIPPSSGNPPNPLWRPCALGRGQTGRPPRVTQGGEKPTAAGVRACAARPPGATRSKRDQCKPLGQSQ